MAAPKSFPWSFRDVSVISKDKVALVAGYDKEPGVSFFMKWTGEWGSCGFGASLISCCPIMPVNSGLLMLGTLGEIVRGTPAGFTQEVVDDSEEGPHRVGDMRDIRWIGGHAYACGMGRTVYRCDGAEAWTRIDQTCREQLGEDDEDTFVGFNSIHGFSETDIYAVGWDGEIWHFNGQAWTPSPSPTELALFRVVCAPDGYVYACGQIGTVLRGKKGAWEVVGNSATKEDFYGAAFFKGQVYLATTDGLFTIADNQVVPVEIVSKKKLTLRRAQSFGKLDANEDLIWSVGTKMAIHSTDGTSWTEVPYK